MSPCSRACIMVRFVMGLACLLSTHIDLPGR